jgi:hypothetical protein
MYALNEAVSPLSMAPAPHNSVPQTPQDLLPCSSKGCLYPIPAHAHHSFALLHAMYSKLMIQRIENPVARHYEAPFLSSQQWIFHGSHVDDLKESDTQGFPMI